MLSDQIQWLTKRYCKQNLFLRIMYILHMLMIYHLLSWDRRGESIPVKKLEKKRPRAKKPTCLFNFYPCPILETLTIFNTVKLIRMKPPFPLRSECVRGLSLDSLALTCQHLKPLCTFCLAIPLKTSS